MKKLIYTFSGLCILLTAVAQPIEERLIEPFKRIHLAGEIDVDLVKGDDVLVKIREVDGADFEDIEARVENDELKIISKLDLFNDIKIVATIIYTDLEQISVSSDAAVYSDTILETNNIKFIAKNGGIIDVKVNADTIRSSVFTGGLIALEGETHYQKASISSGGTLSAFELECDTANISSNTNGIAKVNVKRYINAKSSTGGYINIMGDPAKEIIEKKLGGQIVRTPNE